MIIRLASAILVLFGAAGFFMPFWIGAVPDTDKFEFPLSEISDIAISDQGELFVANTFLGRVQRYNSNGEFLSGFNINSHGGLFCLELTGAELSVVVARRDAADILDLSGKVIQKNIPISEYSFLPCEQDARVETRFDRIVVSIEKAAEPIMIERQPWHYLALNPFMSWVTFAIGLFLFPEWRRSVISSFQKQSRRRQ